MDKPVRVYQCDNTAEGILSAVYEAGISGYGHKYIRIEPQVKGEAQNIALFSEYISVESDGKKVESVIDAVRRKISYRAYTYIMRAAISAFADRGDAIYQFAAYGFSMGDKVCSALQIPWVKRIFEIDRAVANETNHMIEFLRFQEVQREPSLLLAVFEPKHQVTALAAEHFADRFPDEWFIIYDKAHGEAAFHNADGRWEMRLLTRQEQSRLETLSEQREDYVDLWKAFFENIAIEERRNGGLQRNLLPLYYRKHMTEFKE